MAKVTFDRTAGIDLLEERRRAYEPWISIKKSGLVKVNAGLQLIIGDTNRVDEVIGYPADKKMVIVLAKGTGDMGDNRTVIRTQRSGKQRINPQTGNLVKEKLGELSMKSHLIQSTLLPLKGKHTQQKFEDGTGLTVDTESEEGKIIIELDGNKGEYLTKDKVGRK